MSAIPDNGGSAFPLGVAVDADALYSSKNVNGKGMSLRDWFAGQALAGIAGNAPDRPEWHEVAARQSYAYADAMLAERKREE